jgi:FeS assembly protein IscX
MLTWDDTIEIVDCLKKRHPDVDLERISLITIYKWTIELPEFSDDRELCNEEILNSILREWYEEANPI